METIEIEPFPAKGSLKKIAVYIDEQEHILKNHFKVQIPEVIGKGVLVGIDISEDLSFLYFNGEFKKDSSILFKSENITPLHFFYNFKNSFSHKFTHQERKFHIDQFQHSLGITDNGNAHQLDFNAGEHYSFYTIGLNRENFLQKRGYCPNSVSASLTSVLGEEIHQSGFFHHGFYNLKIADLFHQIEKYSTKDFLGYLGLEARVYDLILLHLLQYVEDIQKEGRPFPLQDFEIRIIEKASRIIESRISSVRRVSELAKEVGVNTNKLQLGFKELYGLSVNNFIQETRMRVAEELLKNSELSLSQIVDRIGLSSQSYFSKLFRERYGIAPSLYRKKEKK